MIRLRTGMLAASTFYLATGIILNAQSVPPGTVNYSEGDVALNGKVLTADSDGKAQINPGETLQTQAGHAELLLTPGVYVRMGENSTVKMEALTDSNVKLELVRGQAVVEVDQVDRSQRLDVLEQGAAAHLEHSGVFYFTTIQPAVSVYRGHMRVEDDRRSVDVREGETLLFGSGRLRPQRFDRSETNPIYDWTMRRADFASQVSEWTGEALQGLNGAATFPEGWYWNPWYKSWAFIPAKGYVDTPFGYGIYAPQEPHAVTPVFGDFRN